MNATTSFAVLCALVVSLTGCQMTRPWTGEVASGKPLLLGAQFARTLDGRNRLILSRTTEQTAATGETIAYTDPETGWYCRTSVVETSVATVDLPVRALKDRLQTTPPIELVQRPYEAAGSTNVRGGPGTDYVVVGSLADGETVDVVGRVKGEGWFLIAEGGLASGYVAQSRMTPIPAQVALEQTASRPEHAPAAEPLESAAIQEIVFSSDRTCRVITQEVIAVDKTASSEDVTVCLGAEGWELV
jgi:hypothetical protein